MTDPIEPLAGSSAVPRFAFIVSQFNTGITHGLLAGARAECEARGVAVNEQDIFPAPGAFEIPLIAKKLAGTGRYDGVVCLGCVIKGDTAHFEYISEAASHGLMRVSLECGLPVSFGILTTYTREQAEIRSRDDQHNKGREAAAACIEALDVLDAVGGPAAG